MWIEKETKKRFQTIGRLLVHWGTGIILGALIGNYQGVILGSICFIVGQGIHWYFPYEVFYKKGKVK